MYSSASALGDLSAPALLPPCPLPPPQVDRGFVAQTADVPSGRTAPMSAEQRQVAERKVPLEVLPDIKHK